MTFTNITANATKIFIETKTGLSINNLTHTAAILYTNDTIVLISIDISTSSPSKITAARVVSLVGTAPTFTIENNILKIDLRSYRTAQLIIPPYFVIRNGN